MPSLEDVFAKFGATAEACQLLEIAIGNLLLADAVNLHGLDKIKNRSLARKLVDEVDRKTLGQLIQALKRGREVPSGFAGELEVALSDRNRLNHSFYAEHNLRKYTEDGRQIMLADLEAILQNVRRAYQSASALSEIEISEASIAAAQKGHLPLRTAK